MLGHELAKWEVNEHNLGPNFAGVVSLAVVGRVLDRFTVSRAAIRTEQCLCLKESS